MSTSTDSLFPEESSDTPSAKETSTSSHPSDEAQTEAETRSEVAATPEAITPTGEIEPSRPELPPEAQGEANGGPLGCCLGVTVGLLLSISIAVLGRFNSEALAQVLGTGLSVIIRILMVLIAVLAVIFLGYFGWKIGKSVYREYEKPVQRK